MLQRDSGAMHPWDGAKVATTDVRFSSEFFRK